jgi:hypothetical protein
MSGLPKGFDPVPEIIADEQNHRRLLARALNRTIAGKLNCTFAAFTLNANATTTTLTDSRIYATSYIDFMPTTANAASARASIWVSSQIKGSCTVNHASSPNTDQTFTVVILG